MAASRKLVAFLGLFLVGFVYSAPLVVPQAASNEVNCPGFCADSTNFNYQVGKSYLYEFKSQSEFGSEQEKLSETKLLISGLARITVQSKCNHLLKLENVEITGVEKGSASELIKQLEEKPLAYFFNDGSIENLCPLAGQSGWSLNVKRAILSALQVSVAQPLDQLGGGTLVNERDVLGECDTQYELISGPSEDQTLVLEKRKLLGTCNNRVQIHSALRSGSALGELILRSLSSVGLNQKQACRIQLRKAGIISRSSCSGLSDADQLFGDKLNFNSSMELVFSNEQPIHYPPLTGAHTVTNLLGERTPVKSEQANALDVSLSLKDAVSQQCASLQTLSSNTSDSFERLVQALQASKYADIISEYDQLLANRAAHKNTICCPHRQFKLFVDALVSAKTADTLKVIVDKLVPVTFYLEPKSIRAQWKLSAFYASLAFYNDVTEEHIKNIEPLLKKDKSYYRSALIGVTGMIGSYCESKPDACDSAIVKKHINEITSSLPADCSPSSKDQEAEIGAILHALVNLPSLPTELEGKLLKCVTTENTPLGIRVAALKAAKRNRESVQVSQTAEQLLLNEQTPDELRLTAYRGWIPSVVSDKQLEQLQKLINTGGEVSSFIASHLIDLRSRQDIRHPVLKKYAEFTSSLTSLEAAALSGRSRRVTFNPKLGYILRDNLKVKLQMITDSKTEQSVAFKACVKLANQRLLAFGVRQTLGSAGAKKLADSAQTVLAGVLGNEANIQQLIPQLVSALEGAELWIKFDGKLVYYRAANERGSTAMDLVSGVQYGMPELFGHHYQMVMQVYGFSGVPSVYSLNRAGLIELPQVEENKQRDLLPSLLFTTFIHHRIAVGDKQLLVAQLTRKSNLHSGFSINTIFKKQPNGDWQFRFKLPKDEVEVFSYKSEGELRLPNGSKKSFTSPSGYESRQTVYYHFDEIFGIKPIYTRNYNKVQLVIKQEPNSEFVISKNSDDKGVISYSAKLEGAAKPREFSFKLQHNGNEISSAFNSRSPSGNAAVAFNWTKPNVAVLVKFNEKQYQMKWVREEKMLDKTSQQWIDRAELTMDNKQMYAIVNEFSHDTSNGYKFNEKLQAGKRTLLDVQYNRVGGKSRVKRAVDSPLKSISLKYSVHPLKDDAAYVQGEHSVNVQDKTYVYASKCSFRWFGARPQDSQSNLKLNLLTPPEPNALHYTLDGDVTWPIVGMFKISQKLAFKRAVQFEHELQILPEGRKEKEFKLSHLANLVNFDKPNMPERSMDVMVRLLIAPLQLNREYKYAGKHIITSHYLAPYQLDDKFVATDLNTGKELVSAGLKCKLRKDNDKILDIAYFVHCAKHGTFDHEESTDMGKEIVTNMKTRIRGANEQKERVYSSKFVSPQKTWLPSTFDLETKNDATGEQVLAVKVDFATLFSDNVKSMLQVIYEKKPLVNFAVNYNKASKEGRLVSQIQKLGAIRYEGKNLPDGKRRNWAFLHHTGYLIQGNFSHTKDAINFQSETLKASPIQDTIVDETIEKVITSSKPFNNQKLLITSTNGKPLSSYDISNIVLHSECPKHKLTTKMEKVKGASTVVFDFLNKVNSKHYKGSYSRQKMRPITLIGKINQAGKEQASGELVISFDSPSVIKMQCEGGVLSLVADPLHTVKEGDWKALDINYKRDPNDLNASLRILASGPYVLTINRSGLDSNNAMFKRSVLAKFADNMQNVQINVTHSAQNKEKKMAWSHELLRKDNLLKLDQSLYIHDGSAVVFGNKLRVKRETVNNKKDMHVRLSLEGGDAHTNGASVELSSSYENLNEMTSSFSLEYPYKSRSYSLQIARSGSLHNGDIHRDLNALVVDKKLNYRDAVRVKLSGKDKEAILKFERTSDKGHALELLELSGIYTKQEKGFKFVGLNGWKADGKLVVKDQNFALHAELNKRGRMLALINSNVKVSSNSGGVPSIKMDNQIGWNGTPDRIKEQLTSNQEMINYQLDAPYGNAKVDINLKQRNLNGQVCISDSCSKLVLKELEKNTYELKLDGQVSGKPLKGTVTIRNENNKRIISGEINSVKLGGEILYGNTILYKLNIGERQLVFSIEQKAPGVYQYNYWPNQVKDQAHVHTLQHDLRKPCKQVLTWSNPALKAPVKLSISLQKYLSCVDQGDEPSANITLDYSTDPNKRLTFSASSKGDNNNLEHVFSIHTGDKRLNGGCVVKKSSSFLPNLIQLLIERNCYWAKEGTELEKSNSKLDYSIKKEGNLRQSKMNVAIKAFGYALSWQSMIKRVSSKLSEAWYEYQNNDKVPIRGQLTRLNNACLQFIRYRQPNPETHLLVKACMNGLRNATIASFEAWNVISPTRKEERILLQLQNTVDEDQRLLLHWDPDLVGEMVGKINDFVIEDNKIFDQMSKSVYQEAYNKFTMVANDIKQEVYIPARAHAIEEINQLRKELHLSEMVLRAKREVGQPKGSLLEEVARKVFHVRVVKYSMDEGELDVYFRWVPSAKGVYELIMDA